MDAEPQIGGQNGLQVVGKIIMRFSEMVACERVVRMTYFSYRMHGLLASGTANV